MDRLSQSASLENAVSAAKARNLQLDCLRGLAVLLVIGAHLPKAPYGTLGWVWNIVGGFGVPLFFALSGYLVGGLLICEGCRTGKVNITRFLIRRGFKIYPAYYLFMAYLIAVPALKAWKGDPLETAMNFIRALALNLVFVQNYGPFNPALHTWSVAVEEHFYLTLPFMIAGALALRRLRGFMALCLASPVAFTAVRLASAYLGDPYMHINPPLTSTFATHLWADALFFGVGIRAFAHLHVQRWQSIARYRWLFVAAGVGSLLLAHILYLNGVTIFRIQVARIFQLEVLAGTCLLVGVLHIHGQDFGRAEPLIRPAASSLAWVGMYSYCIYLWHVSIMGIVQGKFLDRFTWGWPGGWYVNAAVVTLCAVVVGAAISRAIEWPALKMRDRWFPSLA